MKLALLADIHSNHFALSAVLDSVEQQKIDTLIIAGDFIGYYFWPLEVFKLLEDWDVVAVKGNHERMLEEARADESSLESVEAKYGTGLTVALDQLDAETIQSLIDLPDMLRYETPDGSLLLCHGSPWDGEQYVYPNSEGPSLDKYADMDAIWIVQGHTHYPMIRKFGDITVVNPGSVGQPRNRQKGAHWALLNTESREVVHFCELYDSSQVVMEAEKRHHNMPYLAGVLDRG
jgi:putative phosphoesterase